MDAQTAAFTQWETDMVVYRADANGRATGEVVFLGGCENRMDIEQGYAEERADRSGDPHSRNQHLEETHVIQLENLWLSRYRNEGGEERFDVPAVGRDARFVVVMVWEDEQSGIWHKRTYFGVQINPLRFDSSQEFFSQNVLMRASYLIASNGRRPAEPTLTPATAGIIRYVTGGASVDLWSYDFEARTLSAQADPTGRIEFAGAGGGYLYRVYVGGELALAVHADGRLLVREIVATGGSFTTGDPRAEFYNGSTRYATLTANGRLAVPNFLESADNPDLPEDFEFRAASWLASLGPIGAYAPGIADTLP